MTTYYYTANGQTAGYEPYVKAGKTAADLKDWAWDKNLLLYECVPDDPQQMFGRTGNQALYYVWGRMDGKPLRYNPVGRERYYVNKHSYYVKPSERHLLIPNA